jgi:eukaryotic-like serine/threonine-protein kinase
MEPPRAAPDHLIGRMIGGRFRLIQRIGSGGMSSVYLARHVLIDRLMAIKTLRRDLAQDPIQRDRFIREARAVNRINHENIVEITDFGETDDGLVYLVMEFVPGEPLLKLLTGEPMETQRAFEIARQCGGALARAHHMGVVHRDLKPENILIVDRRDARGRARDFVKILDFGIAKIMDAPSLTGSQQIFGTPGYIAPEYIQSTRIDGRADLYSLGVILYELITGALPFDYEYPGDLLIKHITEPPIPPSTRCPGLDPEIEAFLLRCMEKDPNRRFRDAFHFLDELQAVRPRTVPSDVPTGQRALPSERELQAATPRKPTVGTLPPIPAPPTAVSEEEASRLAEAARRRASGSPRGPIPVNEQGLLGVRRWRARFDAIRGALDHLESNSSSPPEVEHAMAFTSRTLERLEEEVGEALALEDRIESLSESARELRAELGRSIDHFASELSRTQGELERIASMRTELARRRDVERERLSRGLPTEGRVDDLLFELEGIADSERIHGADASRLAAQLAQLEQKLERENERFEGEIAALVQELDVAMQRMEPMSVSLRAPLERAESYVRAHWPDA